MAPFTRSDAQAITKKLGGVPASTRKFSKHIRIQIWRDGRLFTHFGMRHGRRSSYGHLPKDLGLTQKQTHELADCTMSADEYFDTARPRLA